MTHYTQARLSAVALASLLCAAGSAHAQATVSIYGLVDAGVTQVTGLRQGSVTQVTSGTMEGSRWGMRGNEDLGGGYRAIFTLESRVEVDTGANNNAPITGTQLPDVQSTATLMGLPGGLQGAVSAVATQLANGAFGVNIGGTRIFDRQAFVGLVTPVGAILAGRQYTPAFEVDAEFDISNTQGFYGAGTTTPFLPATTNRIPNALQYRIVTGGVTAGFMYGFGESKTATVSGSANRLIGLMGIYRGDGFAVGLGYNAQKNELAQNALKTTVFGASMNVGSEGKISGQIVKVRNDNPAGLSTIDVDTASATDLVSLVGQANATAVENAFINAFRQDGTRYHIGYKHTTGPHTFAVAYNRYDDKRPNNADVSTYGGMYSYAFSKRTDVYTMLSRTNNSANAQVAQGGNGYFGGVTSNRGRDSTAFGVGLRHRF